ncbi:hypothetical protein diail_4252 [Diaporthe ilicicola]|nr:hypothetical protein diail_4252 [Diaporthe ilicicola]
MQKHLAFECNLCPKRFTRAYNLRSHLRTHTNDRPFVCGVCRKAFTRQNDRETHRALHSVERKFVCKGNLVNGQEWGCGSRFSRKRNLQRHYDSKFGRICIKPLLEERDRVRQWKQSQHLQQQQQDDQQSRHQAAAVLMSLPTPGWNRQPLSSQTDLGNGTFGADLMQGFVLAEFERPYDNRHLDRPSYALGPGRANKLPASTGRTNEHGTKNSQETLPPTHEEALNAAEVIRRYILRHGRLNAERCGVQGYFELNFKSVGSFSMGEVDSVQTSNSAFNQFPLFHSSFPT